MAEKIIFSENDINNIIVMHNNGMLNREIAKVYSVSRSTIGRLLKKANVESRHPWLTEQRKKDVCDLYVSGMNKLEISRIMKMSNNTICKILDEKNIAQRSLSLEHMKYKLDQYYFDDIDSHDKAYFFGLMCADGSVASNGNAISISLQEQDKSILEALKNATNTDRPLYYKKPKKNTHKPQYELTIVNKHMHDSLIRNGMIPRKSYSLVFPKFLDEEYYNSFFRGYSDGDGTINVNDCRYSIILTKEFGTYMKKYIEDKLEIHCSLSPVKKTKASYVLRISGRNQVKKYLDWLYSDGNVFIERKYKIYKKVYYSDSSY